MPMNEGVVLTCVFLAWLVIALVAHAVLARFWVAACLSALLMAGATELASYVEVGYLDPMWPVSTAVAFGLGLIVSLLVGLPFRMARRLQHERRKGGR